MVWWHGFAITHADVITPTSIFPFWFVGNRRIHYGIDTTIPHRRLLATNFLRVDPRITSAQDNQRWPHRDGDDRLPFKSFTGVRTRLVVATRAYAVRILFFNSILFLLSQIIRSLFEERSIIRKNYIWKVLFIRNIAKFLWNLFLLLLWRLIK